MKSWPSNNLQHPLSMPLLLIAVILAVYYPALLSGIHPIDDPGIFARYSASPPISNILFPGDSYYYRPMVGLSFYLDNLLWGMEPTTMHLENILLHCINSLLVFLLARRIIARQNSATPVIPMLAALLFALHPVNVEAVTWIAGRTDPLQGLFILSSCYFLLCWLDRPRWQEITASLLLFGAALLTKETSLAFAAVLLLFVLACKGAATIRHRLCVVGVVTVPAVLLVIFVLIFRSSTSSGLGRFLSGMDLQVMPAIWQALVALGFYVRKLVFPFPLNFAINEVHSLNGFIGIALFPFLWWLVRRHRLSGILFASVALLLLPALLVAVKQIAWTPFAERYLYMSTAFFALGLINITELWQRKYPVAVMTIFAMLLFGAAAGSFQRNLLWKDSFSFFEDAVAKSPEFGSVYQSLGGLLMQKGEIDRALEAFVTAERLNKRDSMRGLIKTNIMGAMLAKGDYLDVRTYFFQLFKVKSSASADFLEILYRADSQRLESVDKKAKVLLAYDLLETLELLHLKRPDPFWLYRGGQISLVAGNSAMAADFFRRAYSEAPVDAYYRAAAKTNYLRLEIGK